ncbi:MAG TPA: efflux RND transporter periplasmic adaptor subunit [Candidatus Binataceae bacterium]|nr:efflux RND transporter periplasmic adaptor subunit [Candidatus Binataceae bacterium]
MPSARYGASGELKRITDLTDRYVRGAKPDDSDYARKTALAGVRGRKYAGARSRSGLPALTARLACAFAAIAIVSMAACSGGSGSESGERDAVPVLVAKVVQKTVANSVHVIGRVEAYSTVDLKARVDGQVTDVHFREGQDVKQGDLLFNLDPSPFKAALAQAEANLAKDRAQQLQAVADEQRYHYLLTQGVGSQQQFDQAHASADALRAVGQADTAAVETAKLNLSYTTIRSPIDGRTGSLLVHPGNLVKGNAETAMVEINQIEPVYVDFSLPEQRLPDVRKFMANHKLAVEASVPGQQGEPERGELSFVDNTVDTKTGTIQLKGIFANRDRRLWPGQFVDATLILNERPDTVVVPSQAIQTGQDGSYVYVVEAGMKVATRTVVIGDSQDGATVVERGLKSGETVVTDGQLRLMPGAHITIKTGLGSQDHGAAS